MSARFRIRKVFVWLPAPGRGLKSAPAWIVEDRTTGSSWRFNSHEDAIRLPDVLLKSGATL